MTKSKVTVNRTWMKAHLERDIRHSYPRFCELYPKRTEVPLEELLYDGEVDAACWPARVLGHLQREGKLERGYYYLVDPGHSNFTGKHSKHRFIRAYYPEYYPGGYVKWTSLGFHKYPMGTDKQHAEHLEYIHRTITYCMYLHEDGNYITGSITK